MLLSILGISWNVIRVTSVMFLCEGALWCPVWMKHTLHVFIALDKGQSILCWVKIIPLSREMLSRHDIILVFPGFSKFFVAQKKHSNVPSYQNQTETRGMYWTVDCIAASLVFSIVWSDSGPCILCSVFFCLCFQSSAHIRAGGHGSTLRVKKITIR